MMGAVVPGEVHFKTEAYEDYLPKREEINPDSIKNQTDGTAEGTFGRLRYTLGGDRPSQTAHLTLSPGSIRPVG